MAGHLIVEGRLAGWIAHQNSIPAFKIWLTCEKEERVRRVAERENSTFEEVCQQIQKREVSEKKRYQAFYNIDLDNLSIYDIVIDTTHNSPIEVENTILKAM
jgi:cytidylate kinase